jgi:hypothetical protein
MFQWGLSAGALKLGFKVGVLRAGVVAALIGILMMPASAGATRGITRAVTDNIWFAGESQPYSPQYWVPKTTASGAKVVLIEMDWRRIEPNAPTAGSATNPGSPEFKFVGYMDPVVQMLSSAGLQVDLLITDAPKWAETQGGPARFMADGAWKPNATALGQFAQAVAARYSGHFEGLPRVPYLQAWAEANFDVHLAPQWVRSRNRWVPYAPAMYRTMLNAFYSGVKAGDPSASVITTGFGPFGDSPGGCSNGEVGPGCRMPPAAFARNLLCLSNSLNPLPCATPAHFDDMAADPYEIGSPTTHAVGADNVSAPDLSRISKPMKKAVATGRALPRANKGLWVTEFSYDSKPINPYGLSPAKQAKWLAESYYVFWEQGVSTAVWYLLRDEAPTFNANSYYSGIYLYNGRPKPSLRAMQFPFVVMQWGKRVNAWGIAPAGGTVLIQKKKGRSWRTLFRLHAPAGGVFVRRVSNNLYGKFRAKVGRNISLIWSR